MTAADPTGYVLDKIQGGLRTQGGHLSIGHGGHSLRFGGGRTLSGYDIDPMKALYIEHGLPVIDSRPVPLDAVWDLAVYGAMIAVGREPDAASGSV